MAGQAEASSSSSTVESSTYDVFLSFRGEDTRKSFTGHLYRALNRERINVYMDSHKLWEGEEIGPALAKAIQGSKISIPIFSKGYADSKWCLKELVKILECHRSNNQIVLPIFLDVIPFDVRHQTGSFKKVFLEHEKNFAPHYVESWKEALKKVGKLKGWVLNEVENGDESKLIELVVERTYRQTSNNRLSDIKYHIGLESRVNDLLPLLNIGSTDVRKIGICGIGGIGKTTIAKALYNYIVRSFVHGCFLANIREEALGPKGLVSVQEKLIYSISKRKVDGEILSIYHGKKWIEEKLHGENALLILDNVDNPSQLTDLAMDLNWLGQGSRVIITTRDEHILNVADIDRDRIYWPQGLNFSQSLQLFSLHAFQQEFPFEEYKELSIDVAHYSVGLPLTLEVLGSYLSDIRSKDAWESTLHILRETPLKEVQSKLKISYDNLENDYQKAIFLDAACFFIGWKKETVISIWEACGFHPKLAIRKLTQRSLLKFDKEECLEMHNHIRDMGREIVREENRTEAGKRSRLWLRDEILKVLEEHKGTDKIEGMMLPHGFYLTSEQLKMMPNLRFLDNNSPNFGQDISTFPSGLKWFRWEYCPWDILPTTFYHESLVCLNLSRSKIKQAWDIRPQDKNNRFQRLKILNINKSIYLNKSPDFSWFPYLEQLDLGNCYSLNKLDESIGQLNKLKSLILTNCWQIKELPESICDLTSLVNLNLMCTGVEKLPNSISRLSCLKELILESCALKRLPESIGDLKSLVELQLGNVSEIEELPDGVVLLEKLELLGAKDCQKLVKLPKSMGRMRCLHSINLKGTSISKLPDDFWKPSNLMELKMSGWFQSLPGDLSHWKNLKQLKLFECKKLEYLPELPSSLVEHCCEDCYSLVRLPDLSRLKILTTLNLNGCQKLEEIRGIEGLESLTELDAGRCYNLTHTTRKILGEGILLPYRSQVHNYSLTPNDGICDKGLILCLVLEFVSKHMDDLQLEQGLPPSIDLDISACICQGNRTIKCHHTLRIVDVRFTTHRHTISIHHLKGFDWFGIPLQGKDVIERLDICECHTMSNKFTVKFWELLFENREPDQQSLINIRVPP